ncbi:NAD-glutamate dehydrogenase [Sphingorhabdus sp. SMR4y]|uniref:NAD-glutamate dehydrogenase n=1 Tax=Sphingorhabdus sp. SMR4y TaxID=2584094 RepID=UPI000B5CC794|nr:NAD-glutamate dehydrogenase domain-containing protein [Sphingorhabdus sp. SMR4y]ASK88829.1 NAD-specific glutamate dehydrogenase [Sphingorhabdus sp. SMR4y]
MAANRERKSKPAQSKVDSLEKMLVAAFRESALPGENIGFDEKACEEAARFTLQSAQERRDGEANLSLESVSGQQDNRHLRLAIVNDDMPFLVDSVCATIAGFGLTIERLIHPVLAVRRDAEGRLIEFVDQATPGEKRESVIYIELERTDARIRRELVKALRANLKDVAAAVTDWLKLQIVLGENADALPEGEGATLLRWFLDRNLTLLGHEMVDTKGGRTQQLGLARMRPQPILSKESRRRAFEWFENGGKAPLIIKSNQLSTVHRHVLMDLIIVPVREKNRITALSIISGMWTSAALAAAPENIPVLRTQLTRLFDKFGFSVSGHAGKSLTHSLTSLPHDLLITFTQDDLEKLALISMSLIDRPRPKLHSVISPLARHLFAFVWLPREQLSTERRQNVENMLTKATGAKILSWSNTLEEGGVSSLRYTLDMGTDGRIPDPDLLDQELENMVRGWKPEVERNLREAGQENRAAILAQRYADCFPGTYQSTYGALEAAKDIMRLFKLERGGQRSTRLYRLASDADNLLRLKIYHLGGALPLSDAVPTLENFGFTVLESVPTPLDDGRLGFIHDFLLELRSEERCDRLIARSDEIEAAITNVLDGESENDAFNQLITTAGIDARSTVWMRAWFRYLRQTGLSYGLITVVEALAEAADVTAAMIRIFRALHDPDFDGDRVKAMQLATRDMDAALISVHAIDDDRILRLFRAVIESILRTNAFAYQSGEALAFKIESAKIPELPAPVPWREIFVYSPRVEGIHLRAGPVARGGLRWSDRRDDFRTEILGLMKAQRVKNAVIVPTGAKGGFFAKQLPSGDDRDAFLAEGVEAYKIFISALLSVTDNIVEGKVVPPARVQRLDEDDPYFVVAADKGTASFSDIANQIAIDRGFWLGDAFASGGSNGYDHKAMGITARGAWVSVQRHFAESGIDIQSEPVRVVGVGDMSGDVFGNGMLLSKSLKIVAAFDHRHIFIDPDPDPAKSWAERKRLFDLPRSSWEDYDKDLISKGGGVFSRSSKTIKISEQAAKMLGLGDDIETTPGRLMTAILACNADLLWFGGIGTYVKAASENHIEVGDPANDKIRLNAEQLRVKVIGEGANLGITQAARIAFAARGGRINTDFIDNSAGVDCSDNEVNIKIALNAELASGKLKPDARNLLLKSMTDDVGALVLEDNRLQALGLSIAEMGGAKSLPSYVRLIDQFEEHGQLNRAVEGLASNEDLIRRGQESRGLYRPELAVLISTAKLALQDAIENSDLGDDPGLDSELLQAFPPAMQEGHRAAILNHQLRREIIATKLANRMINRLGLIDPFELAEEEGCALGEVARAFVMAERLFDADRLWHALETAEIAEDIRITLFDRLAYVLRSHMADLMRIGVSDDRIDDTVNMLAPGVTLLNENVENLITAEGRLQASRQVKLLVEAGATPEIAGKIANIYKNDGAAGIAYLAHSRDIDALDVAAAFTGLGSQLGLDWAQMTATRINPSDPWDRLLVAGLARDFQQMRLDFLRRTRGKDMQQFVDSWAERNIARVAQFRKIMDRAQQTPKPSIAMLAQIAGQARLLLSR